MRQLLLMRHAEAEAARPGLPDLERSLTLHGQTQARGVAQRLRQAGLQPQILLTSHALRARASAAIIAQRLDCPDSVREAVAVYSGGPQELLALLRGCDAAVSTLMLIGHNPGVSALARHLAGASALSTSAAMSAAVSGATNPGSEASHWQLDTAGLCGFELDARSWSELAPQLLRSVALTQ